MVDEPPSCQHDFLAGGGEMGALMRAHAWAQTSLGPPDRWPQALRTSLRLLLNTHHPMYVWWGEELLCFYNDAYRASIGDERHPGSLGQPGRVVWSEIWEVIGPQIDQVMSGRGPTWHENQLVPITRNGRGEDVYWTYGFSPIDDPGAQRGVGGVLVVCTETTAQVAADHRRIEELARQRRMFEQAPSFVIIMQGPEHRVEFINDAHERRFGSRGWVGKPIREAFPDLAGQGFFELLDGVFTSGTPYAAHAAAARFRRPSDGVEETRLLDFLYAPLLDDRGVPTGVFCEGFDVTEREAAHVALSGSETALRRSEEQLRLATDAAEVGLWDVDVVTDTLFWPPRVKQMFGISADEPVSMADFYAGLHPEDLPATAAAYAAAADPGKRVVYDVEYRTLGKEDGVVRWIAAKGRGVFDDDGHCVRMIGTAIDISRRKEAEGRLARSEAHLAHTLATLEALTANAPLGFAFFDADHRYARINHVLAEAQGSNIAAHIGHALEEMPSLNQKEVGRAIDRVFASGQTLEGLEISEPPGPANVQTVLARDLLPGVRQRGRRRVRRPRGGGHFRAAPSRTRPTRLERHPRDAGRHPDGRTRPCMAQLARPAGGAVGRRHFQAVSPSWHALLGHAPEDVVGHHFRDFMMSSGGATTDADAHAAVPRAGLEVPTGAQGSASHLDPFRHLDGSARWISWRTSFEDGLVFGYGRDVTQDKQKDEALTKAQATLQQAHKMEAIGQLTGGLAHDFNNLLQGVAGSLELIRRQPQDVVRVLGWAEAGLRAAQRGAKLTGQLLAFSRSQKLEIDALDVCALLHGMQDLLHRTLGPAIRLKFELEPGEPCVLGDETQLEMALLNLCINARDAMPQGGDLAVATRSCTVTTASDLAPGPYLQITVTDNGHGMAPDVIARAFDPFFTTKGVGKGTGLGLSQVYGMARQAGGVVRIESRPGEGTSVHLFLRRTERQAAAPEMPASAGSVAPTAAATILVVDDDPDVRSFLVDSLELLGYRALQAEDGYAGLAALQRSHPDAMIIDFAMPGITGAEVAREALARRPDLPIIFASGFSDTNAIEEVVVGPSRILRKPFRVDDLRSMLGDVLKRTGHGGRP